MPRSSSPHPAGCRGVILAGLVSTLFLLCAFRSAFALSYFWRDEDGVMHSVGRLVDVPPLYRDQALENRRRQSHPESSPPTSSDEASLTLPASPADPGGQADCEKARNLFDDMAGRLRTLRPRERMTTLLSAWRLCPSDRVIAFPLRDALERRVEEARDKHDYPAVIEAYSTLLELSPDNPRLRYERGVAEFHAGRAEEARKDLEPLSETGSPVYSLASYCLGMLALRERQSDKAERYLKGFLGSAPDAFPEETERAEQELARISEKRGETEKIASIEGGFERVATPHFVFRWDAGDRDDRPNDLIEMVRQSLERAYQQVGTDFGYLPQDKVTVTFYSPKAYRERFGERGKGWKAFYQREDNSIRVMSTLETPKLVGSLLMHEYTHAVVQALSGGRAPSWLNEGLAQIQARKSVYGQTQALNPPNSLYEEIRSAAGKDRYLSLARLERWDFREIAESESVTVDTPSMVEGLIHLAYKEAYGATCCLVARVGMPGVLRILRELKGGADLRTAFTRVYSAGPEVFEKEFLKRAGLK